MKKIILYSILIFLVCKFLVNKVFFNDFLLGDLKISHSFKYKYQLHLYDKFLGYISFENGWYIDKNYIYGTLITDAMYGKDSYFFYDCKNDYYQIIHDINTFKHILRRHNLIWKNFRNINEVEDWSAINENKRKFSKVCPM